MILCETPNISAKAANFKGEKMAENQVSILEKIVEFLQRISQNWILLLVLFLGLSLFGASQSYFRSIDYDGPSCKVYSTYQIFKYAYIHLMTDQAVYVGHPGEHCYSYKYSPTFALFFGLFANLSDFWGIYFWEILSAVVGFFALSKLPNLSWPQKTAFLILILFEWLVCLQNQQTNGLIAMMLVLAWIMLEKEQYIGATGLIVATGFIKLFGLAAILLFIFYPKKFKLGLLTLAWTAFFAALPLIVVPPDALLTLYKGWEMRTLSDYNANLGMSIFGFLDATIGFTPEKTLTQVFTLLVMCISIFQWKKWGLPQFRMLSLSMILIWVVPFNHKAESSTYIIAAVGIALWYFSGPRKWPDHVLLGVCLVLLSVIFSDLVPRWIKNDVAFEYHVKALPATIMWLRVLAEMWFGKVLPEEASENPSLQTAS